MISVEDVLEHYGVKGMKWGVRRSKQNATLTRPQIQRKDRKFEKDAKKLGGRAQRTIYAHAIADFKHNAELKSINSKQKYVEQGKKFKYGFTTNRKLYKQYNDEVAQAFLRHLDSKAKNITNASGTRQFRAKAQYLSRTRWKVTTAPIKHADDGSFEIELTRDPKGFITDMMLVETEMQQSIDTDDILSHYGIKGMKWGQRKKDNPASADSAASTSTRKTVKKKGVHTVSNADLQAAIRRMQLEQDFKRLSVNEKPAIQRWVASTLLEMGKREVQQRVAKKVAGAAIKKAATGGVA